MKISNILRRYSDLKQASFGNIPTLTNQHSFKVSQFHKLLKNSYGKSLSKLQVRSYKKILQKQQIIAAPRRLFIDDSYFQNMCLNNKEVNYVCEYN